MDRRTDGRAGGQMDGRTEAVTISLVFFFTKKHGDNKTTT